MMFLYPFWPKMVWKQVSLVLALIVKEAFSLHTQHAFMKNYVSPAVFNVTVAAYSVMDNTSQCVMISTTDDDVREEDREFTVILDFVTPDAVTVGTPSSVTATVIDNDGKLQSVYLCWYNMDSPSVMASPQNVIKPGSYS